MSMRQKREQKKPGARKGGRGLLCIILAVLLFAGGPPAAFAAGEGQESKTAQPTGATVLIDGKEADFEAYTIDGYNYFKLRDIAAALNESPKQFDPVYEEDANQVKLMVGQPYEPEEDQAGEEGAENRKTEEGSQAQPEEETREEAGDEEGMEKEESERVDEAETETGEEPLSQEPKAAYPTSQQVLLGEEALSLTVYNIDGYNYFKLRDLGRSIDFYVGWDSERWVISIDTGKGYDPSDDEDPWTPQEPEADVPGQSAEEKQTYTLEWVNQYSNYFINHVDGYQIMVPSEMKVDMSDSAIRAVLESRELRLEIYAQPIGGSSGVSAATYKNYSNHFLQETAVHTTIVNRSQTIGRYNAYVLEWTRPKLSRVENDRNYYASVDLSVDSGHIITLLFKSSKPFDTENGSKSYLDMAKTFTTVSKTAAPYTRVHRGVEKTQWNQATKEAFETYFGEDSGLTWGIFEPAAPINYLELESHEREIGYTFPINLYYTNLPTANNNLEYALKNAGERGRILELTLQTTETAGGNMVYDALNGYYDDTLHRYAATIASYGKPVLFRLANEMNGDWCVYCAWHTAKDTEIYVAFYRYVYEIFREEGALANTIWVWNPNEKSFPDFRWNDAQCYYPGDEYVDLVGLTGYNTGTYYPSETWRSFTEIYDPLYQTYAALYDQPFIIGEFSCSKFGGDKAAWVEEMFLQIGKYDKIKAAVWWDGCDWDAQGNIARSYFINDVPEVVQLFRKYIGDEDAAVGNSNGEGVLPREEN